MTPEALISETCGVLGVPPSEVRSKRQEAAAERAIVGATLRAVLGLSYPEIGRLMGGFDHTTAIYWTEKAGNHKVTLAMVKQYGPAPCPHCGHVAA